MGQYLTFPEDKLIRVLAYDGTVRGVFVNYGKMIAEIVKLVDAGPLAALAYSRAGGAAMMMASMLKARQQLGLQLNGNGTLGEIYALCDASLNLRVSVADLHAEGATLSEGLGEGKLQVIRKLNEDEPAYRGVTELMPGGDLSMNLARYFHLSEQIPTAIGLSDQITKDGVQWAMGFLIQALPGASNKSLEEIADRIQALGSLTTFVEQGNGPSELCACLLPDAHVLEESQPHYACPCTRESFARRLVALGEETLTDLYNDGHASVRCDFCGGTYEFNQEQLHALLVGAKSRS